MVATLWHSTTSGFCVISKTKYRKKKTQMAQSLVVITCSPLCGPYPILSADPAMADVLRMRPRAKYKLVAVAYMPSGLRVKMSLADVSRILAVNLPAGPFLHWEKIFRILFGS